MVYSDLDVSRIFAAVSDPTRRSILEMLRSGERAISDLAEPFDMSLPAVSKHVHILENAGLIGIRRSGRVRVCRLQAERLRVGEGWIQRFQDFWTAELDQVERYLAGEAGSGRGRRGADGVAAPPKRRPGNTDDTDPPHLQQESD